MGYKALVVDDNDKNLTLEGDLLEVAGFLVYSAQSAAEGIALALQEIPDVIVMDVRLPDISGIETGLILRKNKSTQHIPIVFVTASVLPEGMAEIKVVTNSGFIGKPINTRTFAQEVRGYIR